MKNENNIGILNKDFVKSHLKYENELENKIAELEYRLKIGGVQNDIKNDIGQYILEKIASHMVINYEEPETLYGLGGTSINSFNVMPRFTISVNSIEISDAELNYLKSISNEFFNRI